MAALASPSELASWMQQDLDTATATQALTLASARFEAEAGTKFTVSTHVWAVEGFGQSVIMLPRQPVVAVTSVTVDGVLTADYVLRGSSLYRLLRWGGASAYASAVVVTYTYGHASVPDDVKEAVLSMAAESYGNPDGLDRMQIGNYMEARGQRPVVDWRVAASRYRVGAVA